MVLANPKEYYDEDGNLINIRKLPDDLARAIKKIKPGEFGTEILHSPLEAATFLAKIHRLFGEFGDQGDAGGTTITIVQLLQQAILPEGTMRQRIDAET
jgi:hypothetical protein